MLDIKILSQLGELTHKLRKEVSLMIKEGLDITQIIDFVELKIFNNGYLPAFPCTVSVNDVAAHYTVFDEGYILKKGDVIKVDFGISHEGYITDNAFTVEIGSNVYEKQMQANKLALDKVMELADIGVTMSDLGKCVNEVVEGLGFNTIHNLSGHQIGRNDLHCGNSVPNYENKDLRKMENGQEYAIEPFVTSGEPRVKSCGGSNILHLVREKPIRDPIAKKLFNYIKENYPHLPFSKRWLLKDFDKRKVLYGVRLLKQYGVILEYEALASVDGAIVTQYEDAVVFHENKKYIITRL